MRKSMETKKMNDPHQFKTDQDREMANLKSENARLAAEVQARKDCSDLIAIAPTIELLAWFRSNFNLSVRLTEKIDKELSRLREITKQ